MFFFESLGTGSDSEPSFFWGTEPAPEIVELPKPNVHVSQYKSAQYVLYFSAKVNMTKPMSNRVDGKWDWNSIKKLTYNIISNYLQISHPTKLIIPWETKPAATAERSNALYLCLLYLNAQLGHNGEVVYQIEMVFAFWSRNIRHYGDFWISINNF